MTLTTFYIYQQYGTKEKDNLHFAHYPFQQQLHLFNLASNYWIKRISLIAQHMQYQKNSFPFKYNYIRKNKTKEK